MTTRKTFRKQITTPELIEQINPKNKKLVERFLRDKNARCSDGTIAGYESDLNIFFCWNVLHNDNKFFVDIKKIEFSDFFSFGVEDLEWSPSRFGRIRSCLSSLSNFVEMLFDDDYPDFRNVILKAIESMPKSPVRERTVLTEDQVNSLLHHLSVELNRPQEACWLALAVASGARIAEVMRITTDIIDEDVTAFDGMFLKTTKKIKTKGRTKAGTMLTKYIIKDIFLPYYHAWLPERDKIMIANGEEHNSIFIRRDGKPATEHTARGWFGRWAKHLEVPFYPHALRAYIVSHLTRLGLSSDFIVEIMGWKSADMYKVYNDVTAEDREWKELGKLKDHLSGL